jgi:voltage-gated potassium channel
MIGRMGLEHEGGTPPASRGLAKAWNILFMTLLAGSVALVFWYEGTTDAAVRAILVWVDLGLVVLFFLEWLWRVVRNPAPGRTAVRQSWELLGMVPLILPLPVALRLLRLVRLVRILRVFGAVGRSLGFWERIAKQGHLRNIAIAAGLVTLVGAVLVWAVERHTNPDLETFGEALWWAIVTVTTVGYGDITPNEPTGRIVASGLMVTGIGVIGLLASTLASALVLSNEEEAGGGRRDTGDMVAPLSARAGSLADQLLTLAELHRRGDLDDAQYEAAKDRVLGPRP